MNLDTLKLKFFGSTLRVLPVGLRGKARLARLLLNSSLDERDVQLISSDQSKFITPSLREPIGFHLLIDGIYEKLSLDFIRDNLPRNGTFLDIGANIGLFAIVVSRFMEAEGKIIAVEASPRIFSYLQRNIEINQLSNINPLELAVTDTPETTVSFYEPPIEKFGMGSIAPQFHADPIYVKTTTLDTIIAHKNITKVDLIKVDVEGYEAAVFRGGQHLLGHPQAPKILFEFLDWAESRVPDAEAGDAQKVLLDFGYKIWRLQDYLRNKEPLDSILVEGSDMLVAAKD
jgi:FkbM family methyltransferase